MSKETTIESVASVKTVPASVHRLAREVADRHNVHADVISDPAHADQLGTDWTNEGGATPTGPATHDDA